jgi:hypothetical protein
MRHRGWSAWQSVAYYAVAIAVVVIGAILIGGCATRREVELTLRVRELEQIVAGKDDDNAMLMRALAEQQGYIGELERGAMWQAGENARLRDTCEL